MGIKRAVEFLKNDTLTHNRETCCCGACKALKELGSLDQYRPPEHRIERDETQISDFVETHESFGMIHISRISSNSPLNLFGSDVKHSNLISLRIKRGERHRGLSRDSYHDRGSLVEVWMSEVQFAQAITTLNFGSGVPITITRLMGEGMEPCPARTKMAEVSQEFGDRMKRIGSKVAKLDEHVRAIMEANGPIKVSDKKDLLEKINFLLTDVGSNLPFMAEQFTKTVDDIMAQAKGEIEAYFTSVVTRAGMEALNVSVDGSKSPIELEGE